MIVHPGRHPLCPSPAAPRATAARGTRRPCRRGHARSRFRRRLGSRSRRCRPRHQVTHGRASRHHYFRLPRTHRQDPATSATPRRDQHPPGRTARSRRHLLASFTFRVLQRRVNLTVALIYSDTSRTGRIGRRWRTRRVAGVGGSPGDRLRRAGSWCECRLAGRR